jgi:4-amino-4-deoxy-L-arabinose transferase-like glycosyltransferase
MTTLISKFKLLRNPFLLFLPFLLLYILIVLFLQSDTLWGDEDKYLTYAQNLLHGFYSGPDPNLSCGPGYPILLMPFVALHLPLLVIKLVNPVLYYLSVVFLFKVVNRIASFKIAVIVGVFWACYINAYENLPLILTETFAIFLVAALMLSLIKAFDPSAAVTSKKYIYLSGFLLGYLVLTKVIFGYVMVFMLIGSIALWLFGRKNKSYKKAVIVLVIALGTTIPYLVYTYNLTGRLFYWSTVSGNNLYWMSTPYKNEFGNWMQDPKINEDSITAYSDDTATYFGGSLNLKNRLNYYFQGYDDSVKANHWNDYKEINQSKTMIERDDAFKRIAIRNIKSHPMKFIQNWICNVSRILFNYPYSYKTQEPGILLRLPMSGIIVVLILFCLIPTCINWRKIDFSIRFIFLVVFIYLGGSTLGSAETRMFSIAVPMLLVWIVYILKKTAIIKLRFSRDEKMN